VFVQRLAFISLHAHSAADTGVACRLRRPLEPGRQLGVAAWMPTPRTAVTTYAARSCFHPHGASNACCGSTQ
jgi:hypothetical protein